MRLFKSNNIFAFLLGLFLMVGFQNCAEVGFSEISDTANIKGGNSGTPIVRIDEPTGTPTERPPENNEIPLNNNGQILTRVCGSLNQELAGYDVVGGSGVNEVNDLTRSVHLNGASGKHDLIVKNAAVSNVSGSLNVMASEVAFIRSVSGSATITSEGHIGDIRCISGGRVIVAKSIGLVTSGSGSANISASGHVDAAGNGSGNFTIKAKSIGLITTFSGSLNIEAESIETLNLGSGSVKVHKAQVQQLVGSIGSKLCLYDGAKILSLSESENLKHKCD